MIELSVQSINEKAPYKVHAPQSSSEYYFFKIVRADNPELQNLVSQFDAFTEFLKSKI